MANLQKMRGLRGVCAGRKNEQGEKSLVGRLLDGGGILIVLNLSKKKRRYQFERGDKKTEVS